MTAPYYSDDRVTVHAGDCLDVLATLPDASVDAVVTDPPYGLANTTPAQVADTITRWVNGERDYLPSSRGFMGHEWDGFVPPVAVWDECFRVLKPGGHMAVFAGSRTQDLMGLSIRLAGFDLRDSVAWLYGSGFPKSLDVSKAIDKAAGAEREIVGTYKGASNIGRGSTNRYITDTSGHATDVNVTTPATPEAEQWQGWGTALKPGHEPIILARKPFPSTVAANVLEWGTGALNIDGCRLAPLTPAEVARSGQGTSGGVYGDYSGNLTNWNRDRPEHSGRWPANVALDADQAEALDQQSGQLTSGANPTRRGSDKFRDAYGTFTGQEECTPARGTDQGGASRFFYTAKADSNERPRINGIAHPTVKPLDLIRWLVRLVTPPGGKVLDPFAGSGTTAEACLLEGLLSIIIEREADYLPLIVQRIHRRLNPVEAIRQTGGDLGLFGEPT